MRMKRSLRKERSNLERISIAGGMEKILRTKNYTKEQEEIPLTLLGENEVLFFPRTELVKKHFLPIPI